MYLTHVLNDNSLVSDYNIADEAQLRMATVYDGAGRRFAPVEEHNDDDVEDSENRGGRLERRLSLPSLHLSAGVAGSPSFRKPKRDCGADGDDDEIAAVSEGMGRRRMHALKGSGAKLSERVTRLRGVVSEGKLRRPGAKRGVRTVPVAAAANGDAGAMTGATGGGGCAVEDVSAAAVLSDP